MTFTQAGRAGVVVVVLALPLHLAGAVTQLAGRHAVSVAVITRLLKDKTGGKRREAQIRSCKIPFRLGCKPPVREPASTNLKSDST